ncbi:hypothetical protein BH18ACT4_BH18ACT4_03100 [soil metagenome]
MATATIVAVDDTANETEERGETPRQWRAIEVVLLALSPIIACVITGFQRMVTAHMIDPSFYTAYAQHGPELVNRYGTVEYFWVRVGFIFPARLTYLLFGPVGGFLTLRYLLALLAVVPVYVLFRRLRGVAVASISAAVILTSPVILHAWGTDYPDSTAVSYLFAGIAALFMPTRSLRERLAWLSVAGIALTLAVHSQAIVVPLVVACVIASVVVGFGRDRWRAVLEMVPLAVWAVLVTGGLMVVAHFALGSGNLITPTLRAIVNLRTPTEVAKWHSPNWRWVLNDPYLFVPPAIFAAWAATKLLRRRLQRATVDRVIVDRAEAGIVLAAVLQFAIYWTWQFHLRGTSLEYYFYSSMVWPGVAVVTAFLVADLTEPLLRDRRLRWAPVALVVAVPLGSSVVDQHVQFDMVPLGAILVVALVAAAAATARWVGALTATAGVAVVLALAVALTIGKPLGEPLLEGQVLLPAAEFGRVIWTDDSPLVDRYQVISEVHELVPPPAEQGDLLMPWWAPMKSETTNMAAAQWLWHHSALPETLPELTPFGAERLRSHRPGTVLMLSDTGREFEPAMAALHSAGFDATVLRTEALRSGDVVLHVQVVTMKW